MRSGWVIAAVSGLLVLPLVVACVWLRRHDHYAPVFDLAMTEVRVRDVGTMHTPLVGLPGRLGSPETGSHPGPLSFYLLAPIYRLLGGSYWALRVSTATYNAAAIACALMVARRAAGTAGVIGAGVGLALLEIGFGLLILTEPWNPHLPVFWFAVFLVAIWSVAVGHDRTLPLAVAAGSLCAQTHIPYFGICGSIGFLAFAWVLASALRTDSAEVRRDRLRSSVLAAAVGLAAWTPPLVDEIIGHPGNLSILFRFFTHPTGAPLGLRAAIPLVLARLDGWNIVVTSLAAPGTLANDVHAEQPTLARGAVFLSLWTVSVLTSVKLRNRALLALHAVSAAVLVVAWVCVSRIVGPPWLYLLFSVRAVGILILVATASTIGVVARRRTPERWRTHGRFSQAAAIAAIGACALRLAAQPESARGSAVTPSMELAELAPAVSDALLAKVGAATGVQGRYLVTASDGVYGGAQMFGLVDELERRGFRAGVVKDYGRFMTEHRVLAPWEATMRLHVATGGWIYEAARVPGAVRVAYSDPRSGRERAEFARLRKSVFSELQGEGRRTAVALFDRNFAAAAAPGMNPLLGFVVGRMAEIGVPAAVFVLPPR